MSRRILATWVAIGLLLAACADNNVDVVSVDAEWANPVEGIATTVAYSDMVIEFKIVSDREIKLPETSEGASSSQEFVVEVVNVVWASDAIKTPTVGEQFSFTWLGWETNPGGEQRYLVADEKELEMAGTYFAAFERFESVSDDGLEGWRFTHPTPIMRSVDGRAVSFGTSGLESFEGQTAAELAPELESVASRPEVAAFDGLASHERAQLLPPSER